MSKRSMMHSSHCGAGLIDLNSPHGIVDCTGRGGLEPQLSQTGSGVFAILGSVGWESGVSAMLGERAGRYGWERKGRAAFELTDWYGKYISEREKEKKEGDGGSSG
jgi:hypothetical protein